VQFNIFHGFEVMCRNSVTKCQKLLYGSSKGVHLGGFSRSSYSNLNGILQPLKLKESVSQPEANKYS
jgi:hypothetical protein